jgi:ribosomal subunit interface protein
MRVNITARHFKAWPELQEAVTTAANNFTKHYEGITSTEIILAEEHGKMVEFVVHVNDHILSSKDESFDFDKSIHHAADKMIAQLRKLKEKQSSYRR